MNGSSAYYFCRIISNAFEITFVTGMGLFCLQYWLVKYKADDNCLEWDEKC